MNGWSRNLISQEQSVPIIPSQQLAVKRSAQLRLIGRRLELGRMHIIIQLLGRCLAIQMVGNADQYHYEIYLIFDI